MDAAAPLVLEVLGEFGLPVAGRRTAALTATATGRGLVALLRCALLPRATVADLLAYLRAPGVVEISGFVDDLEAWVRRKGVTDPVAVRERWTRDHWPLDALDRMTAAAERGAVPLLRAVEHEAARLFALPYRGAGHGEPRLDADGRDEAQALRAVRRWTTDLIELARADASLAPAPDEVPGLLTALRVRTGADAGPEAIAVLDPLQVRARRVRALYVVRAQEQELPALVRPDPFLDDDDRRVLAATTGLRLPLVRRWGAQT